MEQIVDLQIEGNPEDIAAVFDYLKVDKTQRSDNPKNIFEIYEKETDENSLCSGYTDKDFDVNLDRMYADEKNVNNIYFKSYHKNLFAFANFLSSKFPSARFKISWIETIEGDQNLFVANFEKSCVLYFQHGVAYTKIAPNYNVFIKENNLEKFVENHTRIEQEKI